MAERARLDSVDAAWLNIDRPENTADVVALLGFAEPFRFEEFRRLIEERLLVRPLFKERIVSKGLLQRPVWEKDTRFQLSRHLVRCRLHGRGRTAVQPFVSEVATEPLEMHRPLWRMSFIDGAGGGRLVVVKLHHCLGDGFALVGLLLSPTSRRGTSPPAGPFAPSGRFRFRGGRRLGRSRAKE